MTPVDRIGVRTFTVEAFDGPTEVWQAFIERSSTSEDWQERDIFITPLLPPEVRFLLRDTYLEEVEAELRSNIERTE